MCKEVCLNPDHFGLNTGSQTVSMGEQAVERERTRAQARAKQLEEELGTMKGQQEALHGRIREVNQVTPLDAPHSGAAN
jgi:hypothetical protein